MLTELRLRQFRCFEALRVDFAPGFNFLIAPNGEGKTSILEAACVLLRLQSQRSSSLAPLIKIGQKSFALAGHCHGHALEFRYGGLRRKLAFDEVEQRSGTDYLRIGRVVSLANTDIDLTRGGSDFRRRYLDFLGTQIEPAYRPTLRAYERALRARNALLKAPQPREREIAAYDAPLVEHGNKLSALRAALVEQLRPPAEAAHREISGANEALALEFAAGNEQDFAADLARSRPQQARLRQTIVGPHRDDILLRINGMSVSHYASEGQQRTVALALKIAQARIFMTEEGAPPLLLIDDIFGELDPARRNRLLAALPSEGQKLVTATSMTWQESPLEGPVFTLARGVLHPSCS